MCEIKINTVVKLEKQHSLLRFSIQFPKSIPCERGRTSVIPERHHS